MFSDSHNWAPWALVAIVALIIIVKIATYIQADNRIQAGEPPPEQSEGPPKLGVWFTVIFVIVGLILWALLPEGCSCRPDWPDRMNSDSWTEGDAAPEANQTATFRLK